MATNPVRESSAEDASRLRDSLNSLLSLMAQPALWTEGKPPHAVSAAMDVLLGRTHHYSHRC